MNEQTNRDTLFDHEQRPETNAGETPGTPPNAALGITCKTLKPGCGCGGDPLSAGDDSCDFASWVASVAIELYGTEPEEERLPDEDRGLYPDPHTDPLPYLLSKQALGSHYPGRVVALPGFYVYAESPLDKAVVLTKVLYSKAHDPVGELGIEHQAGRKVERDIPRFGCYFAAGFIDKGSRAGELAYAENDVNLLDLVCWTQEDLEALYRAIMSAASWPDAVSLTQ